MAKATIDELEVLRFFETESLERASLMFKIVAEKMRTRLHENHVEPELTTERRKRPRRDQVSVAQSPEHTPAE